MKSLFDQTNLAGMKLKNRFIRSATYEGLADERGHMTEEFFQVYENLARGGVGTIITGLACITDLEGPVLHQMGIYDDSFIAEYQKLTAMSHSYDVRMILQIAVMGSQTFPGKSEKTIWGPSAVENLGYKITPLEMSSEDILSVQEAFALQ